METEKIDLPASSHRSEIGIRMKLTRIALELRPVDVCRITGLAPNAYSQYESGARRVNLEDAIRLKIALGVSLDWIYIGEKENLPFHLANKINELSAKYQLKD